jgi:hypothetical protein
MITDRDGFVITFPDLPASEAGILADDLRDAILDADGSVFAERRRGDSDSMDFGATLVLILGTGSAVAVAQGIKRWLERHQSVKLRITHANGMLVAENLSARHAIEIAKLFSK